MYLVEKNPSINLVDTKISSLHTSKHISTGQKKANVSKSFQKNTSVLSLAKVLLPLASVYI